MKSAKLIMYIFIFFMGTKVFACDNSNETKQKFRMAYNDSGYVCTLDKNFSRSSTDIGEGIRALDVGRDLVKAYGLSGVSVSDIGQLNGMPSFTATTGMKIQYDQLAYKLGATATAMDLHRFYCAQYIKYLDQAIHQRESQDHRCADYLLQESKKVQQVIKAKNLEREIGVRNYQAAQQQALAGARDISGN